MFLRLLFFYLYVEGVFSTISHPHPANLRLLIFLAESSGLTLSLEQNKDVANSDGALDVTDDGTLVVHELDADLSDSTTGASAAEDLDDGAKLGLVSSSRRHCCC